MSRTAAVTGATGFIGSHIVRQLGDRGWQVRMLTRRPPISPFFGPHISEAVIGDLADRQSLELLVRGADLVIHAAGLVKARSRAEFFDANCTGTRLLAEVAAAQTRLPHFILLSSLAAREPMLSDYAASKHAAEIALASVKGQLPWSVLRPPAVYGPGDREILGFFKQIEAGVAVIPSVPNGRLSLLHVEDLAAAIASTADAPGCVSRMYEIDDGHPDGYSWGELIAAASQAVGRRVRRIALPASLILTAGRLNIVAGRITGRPVMLTAGKGRELVHPDWVARAGHLDADTGWQPNRQIAEGFAETVAWYRQAGWL